MKYWLMKSEPNCYSWADLIKDKKTGWDGVRNYQARNNMKAMELGDLAFLYHSINGKEIVGIMKISKLYHPDHTDATGKFGMVEVKPVKALKKFVNLAEIKANPKLKEIALIKQSRLSVCPIRKTEWDIICKMAEA